MKGRSKVAIPHLTGGLNNKLNQLIEFSESLNHPVFLDRQGNHITNHDIVRLYEESQTANDKKPLVYIFHAPNNEELARRNPAKPSKRKTNARDKYMANLLGGKDGNDLLNLASKVGSRKAAVELLKSSGGKNPYNVEIPMTDEDEIQSLKMQGLSPSNDALVDQAYRKKLENQIVSYLGTPDPKIKDIDKGVLITDELITDFRQMLTVYHLTHQMNGPIANAIKGHVPRSKSQVFDRLIPSFDDILAGENLILFANRIITAPNQARYIAFLASDTLIPPWLDFAQQDDRALSELRQSLGTRETETFLQQLAGGDLLGALRTVGAGIRERFEIPLTWLFGVRRERQDDRQARMFDDLIENITDALVSDFGRGRGYTNRKELAKAVVYATEDAYDKRITDIFSPLRATVNAARRVRRFSPSGATMKLEVDFSTADAGDVKPAESVGRITPGMFYIGNYDFQVPPIGWNRKWMVATAQIIHEYWDYIRPADLTAANKAFMPSDDNQSLNLPQILYLIGIRVKELYNYDLAPEEWLVLIQVLGGDRALTENYYVAPNQDYLRGLDDLQQSLENILAEQREAVAGIARGRRARRANARRNPVTKGTSKKSALPHVYNSQDLFNLQKTLNDRAKTLDGMMRELVDLREKASEAHNANNEKNVAFFDEINKDLRAKLKEQEKDTGTWLERATELQGHLDLLENAGHKIVEVVKEVEVEKSPKVSGILGRKLMELFFESDEMAKKPALIRLVEDYDIPGYTGQNAPELQKLVKDYFKNEFKAHDPKALDFLNEVHESVEEEADEIVEAVEAEVGSAEYDAEVLALKKKADEGLEELMKMPIPGDKPKGVERRPKKTLAEAMEADDSLPDLPEVLDYASDRNNPEWTPPKSYFDTVDKYIKKYSEIATLSDGDDKGMLPAMVMQQINNEASKVPKSPKPTVYLGDTGKIVILGDTHADYLMNEKLMIHIRLNYEDAKHVVWLGDTVDGGRGPLFNQKYNAFEDDIQNLDFIDSLVEEDPKKYIPLQGNHERRTLASFSPRPFWDEALDTQGFKWTITKELKEFSTRPAIAVAGRTIMMHGNFPHRENPVEKGLGYTSVSGMALEMKDIHGRPLSNAQLLDILWQRREELPRENKEMGLYDPGHFDDDWIEQLTSLGLNTQIVAHTPSIAAVYLRDRIEKGEWDGNKNGMFYDRDGLLGASLQSNCGTGKNAFEPMERGSLKTEYFVLDLDNDELIIEEFDNMGNHVQTLRQKTPPQKSAPVVDDDLDLGRRNPAGDYHKYEKKVISILKKEGGAAGLDALKPAFPKKTTKAKARSMLKKMNHVVQHQDGDYILVRGISNPMDYAVRAEESIKGTHIQTSPGPKGENCGSCIYMCPTSGRCSKWSEMAGWPVFVLEDWYCKAYEARPKNNMPFIKERYTGVMMPTPGTDKAVVTMFYELMKNFDEQRSQTFAEAQKSILEAENQLEQQNRLILKEIREMRTSEADRGIKDHQSRREIKENQKIINRLADDLKIHRKNLKKLTDNYGKDMNRATEPARALEEQKKAQNAVREALMRIAEDEKLSMLKPAKRKNPQLPACSYRKSKRSKACGGKLRAKKNPKGRIVCTDCGAEYEMR